MAELQARMSSREFAEWTAYYRIEPFGQDRVDIPGAIIASTLANVFRGEHEPFSPSDFMPSFEQQENQSPEHMLAVVEMLNAAFMGEDLRK